MSICEGDEQALSARVRTKKIIRTIRSDGLRISSPVIFKPNEHKVICGMNFEINLAPQLQLPVF